MAEKTKKPTGLKLTRNKNVFTASWSIADKDYADGQSLQYRLNSKGRWLSVRVGTKDTKKAIPNVNTANFYPSSGKPVLNNIQIRVKGNRKAYTTGTGKKAKQHKPIASDWAYYTYVFKVPKQVTVTVNKSEEYAEVCNFDTEVVANDGDQLWFRDVQYQSVLVKDCDEADGKKITFDDQQLGWKTGTKTNKEDSIEIEEDTSIISQGSYTRWIRVRSRGVKGAASNWEKAVYKKYVYAKPNSAIIKNATVTDRSTGGYTVAVEWQTNNTLSHPVKSQTMQYLKIKPDAGIICPASDQWVSVDNNGTFKGADEIDNTTFEIPTALADDECLFLRVKTDYGGETTDGVPYLARKGKLATPENLNVSFNNNVATVTCTNRSEVDGTFLAITVYPPNKAAAYYAGVIPNGSTSTEIVVPDTWQQNDIIFSAKAVEGTAVATTGADTITKYAVTARMESEELYKGGKVIQAPKIIGINPTNIPGTIQVKWDGGYDDANSTEISWADHADAWESTNQPSEFTINGIHVSQWNISGLETGKIWYVRVRSINGSGEDATKSPWSEIASINLAAAPAVPTLVLNTGAVTATGRFTASWVYSTNDGTPQGSAVVAEKTGTAQNPVYKTLAELTTEQQVTINVADFGWQAGEEHLVTVRVRSASGELSDGWAIPVSVIVADPLECLITASSLTPDSETVDGETRTFAALIEMPLTINVSGAGQGGSTTIAIVRAENYHEDRPDENEFNGFEGETIYLKTIPGNAPFEINADDENLIGRLDDGAAYRIIATVTDGLGQKATATSITLADDSSSTALDSAPTEFDVNWEHQANLPSASVVMDAEHNIAKLTPIAPEDTEDWQLEEGDVCDIYRLSVDKPVLLYPGATFGETYVDPYPAIGEFGGHRFVFHSKDGDYIYYDEDGAKMLAWYDTHEDEGDLLETEYNIIEWANGQVLLMLNVDLNNSWSKDFSETKYLGGSIQGDWNPAVSRQGSFKAIAIVSDSQDTIEAMRRLGTYAGICHLRTKDGSSYACNIDVSEDYNQDSAHKTAEFSLTITGIDPEGFDGLTLAEWQETEDQDEE